ncbi:hypothetical protein GCM10007079_08880 [Nocardiopsis terrae]|nr:hypothetical protein GCM10007079_08880 [Nocardiopsis terrae]
MEVSWYTRSTASEVLIILSSLNSGIAGLRSIDTSLRSAPWMRPL